MVYGRVRAGISQGYGLEQGRARSAVSSCELPSKCTSQVAGRRSCTLQSKDGIAAVYTHRIKAQVRRVAPKLFVQVPRSGGIYHFRVAVHLNPQCLARRSRQNRRTKRRSVAFVRGQPKNDASVILGPWTYVLAFAHV